MREKTLEDRELEMAQILNRLQEQKQILIEIETNCQRTKDSLDSLLSEGANIDFINIKNHQDYIDTLRLSILSQEQVIAEVEIELEVKKREVVEAMKAKTILEKLKEKEYDAFLKEYERLDLIQVDEIGISRYKRG